MLTKDEKALFIMAYFLGTMDRDILSGTKRDIATRAGTKAMNYLLEEFGLSHEREEEAVDFVKELDQVSRILSKEMQRDIK